MMIILTELNWIEYVLKNEWSLKVEIFNTKILAAFFRFLLVLKYKMLSDIALDIHYWGDFFFLCLYVDTSDQVLKIIFWKHGSDFKSFYNPNAMFRQPYETHFLRSDKLLFDIQGL